MSYDSNNIFARILRGEIPNKTIYEDAAVLAFHDVAPAAPIHALVVPKGEYRSFDEFTERAEPEAQAHFWAAVRRVAHQLGLVGDGYRVLTNHGAHAGQTVPHFHVHILGGKSLGPLG